MKRKQKKEDTKKQQPKTSKTYTQSVDSNTVSVRSRERKAAIESSKASEKRSAIEALKAKRHARKTQGLLYSHILLCAVAYFLLHDNIFMPAKLAFFYCSYKLLYLQLISTPDIELSPPKADNLWWSGI